jgi:uncharacterized RDD family membrane protein YckC
MTTTPPEPPDGQPATEGTAESFGIPPFGGEMQPGFAGMASIPAPPGQWVGPPLAEWPLRALSFAIDVVLPWAPYWILAELLDSFLLGVLAWLVVFVYIQYTQGTTGQSPGKRVAKTKLLREADGRPIGFGTAMLRGLLHYVVDLFSCTLGFFWPIWDPKRQTFSDKIVSSVVVRDS